MKQVFNPYLPLNEYIPDGEPHIFGDRVYIYGSHDKEGGDDFCMLDYVTWSAPVTDLKDWRYEGVIYQAKRDPLYPKYKYMYAPDVVRGNDGRYYLYYSLANTYPDCSYIMGVAVCDTPCGEFEYLGFVRHKDGTPMQDYAIFDPACLNDNGVIRFYYGMWFDFDEVLAPVAEATGVTSRSFAEEPGNAGVIPYISIIVPGAELYAVTGFQLPETSHGMPVSFLSGIASVSPFLVEPASHRHIGEPAGRTVICIRPNGIIHHLPQQHSILPAYQAYSYPAKD